MLGDFAPQTYQLKQSLNHKPQQQQVGDRHARASQKPAHPAKDTFTAERLEKLDFIKPNQYTDSATSEHQATPGRKLFHLDLQQADLLLVPLYVRYWRSITKWLEL